MTHLPVRGSAAAIVGALALAFVPVPPAAAQPRVPATTSWYALPTVVPTGSTVIVRTRDGRSVEGRLSSLSDTAIALDGGRVKSIPAADVVAIEGGREGRSVKHGAALGGGFGLLFGLGMAASALDESYCDPESSLAWSDVLLGGAVVTAVGAGIGAGIGLVVPPKQVLVYSGGSWAAVPRNIAEGARIVVKTQDGRSTKGRLRHVSDTAIVVDSGTTMTIAAADVESITEARRGTRVGQGAAVGITAGILLTVMVAGGALSEEYCDCDDGSARDRALLGSLAAPVIGAGIGAGIGLMVPGKRALIYRLPAGPAGVSLAPIAGRGQRGVVVRVTF